jgi:hypothetical protein
MMFGHSPDAPASEPDSRRIIDAYLVADGNFTDPASIYTGGESAEVVGRALRSRRDDVVLATRGYGPIGTGPNMAGSRQGTRSGSWTSPAPHPRRREHLGTRGGGGAGGRRRDPGHRDLRGPGPDVGRNRVRRRGHRRGGADAGVPAGPGHRGRPSPAHKLPARLLIAGTPPRTAAGKVRKADRRHLLAKPADDC